MRATPNTNLSNKLNEVQVIAHRNLNSTKIRSKRYYVRVNACEFNVSNRVYLLKEPIKNKLGPQYTDPHTIIEVRNNNVRLEIKVGKLRTVHTDKLEKKVGVGAPPRAAPLHNHNQDEKREVSRHASQPTTSKDSSWNYNVMIFILLPMMCFGLMDYDYEGSGLNHHIVIRHRHIITLSLDIGTCNVENLEPESTETYIQLMQFFNFNESITAI
ncbi:hypothetical protein P5V15_010361 [Pogonomyrmex californicus]